MHMFIFASRIVYSLNTGTNHELLKFEYFVYFCLFP